MELIGRVFAFVVVAALLVGAYFAADYLVGLIAVADSATKSAVISVLGSVAIGAFAYLSERKKARAEAHRTSKVEIYGKFLNMLFGLFFEDKITATGLPSDLVTDDATRNKIILELKRDLVLWSSPSVINAFSKMFGFASSPSKDDVRKQSRLIVACIKAMRKDIGLTNFGLSDDFLLEIVIAESSEVARFKAPRATKPK